MSSRSRRPRPPDSLRVLAERRMEETASIDLKSLTPDEIQALFYELEVHKIELKIQNEQLWEAQRAAENYSERLRRLYDSAPTGYLTLDSDELIVEANLSISLILKTPRPHLIGRRLSAFVAAHCQDRWHLARRDLKEGRTRKDLTLEIVSADGSAIDLQIVGTSAVATDTTPREIHLVLIDVTELRRTERALQAAVAAATLAEERERRKLAADLHDDAGQLLSLASLKLNALGEASEVERGARLADLEDLLVEIRRRISSLSFQLSPPLLHDVGLIAAVQWLAEDLETSHGLSVKILEEHELKLDENARVTFYRAIRELLLNVVKHAGVKEARVRVSREGGIARIAVEDGGVGMPPRAKRYGFGLLALRERVEQLGGSLETRSTPGSGTTVVVSLPTRPSLPNLQGGAR
ncbi:MAG TPA: ATP-binding protein [Candidatus Krumholzibacteria bacterium]